MQYLASTGTTSPAVICRCNVSGSFLGRLSDDSRKLFLPRYEHLFCGSSVYFALLGACIMSGGSSYLLVY